MDAADPVECASVAVLADVHGVLPVLEAVLADPEVRRAERIVVCGDHAAGPQPVEVLDLLAALPNAELVRGNSDRELVEIRDGSVTEALDIDIWAAKQLENRHVDLLREMPHPVTLSVSGFGPVVFCHGTPRADDEVVLVDSRLDRWADVFADLADQVGTVVCGHTHMPFVRLAHGRTVINPGSIGMPYGSTGGHWALLRAGNVSLRRVPIDVDAAVDRVVAESRYPGRRSWADEYIRGTNSDADALRAFGPRDGRGGETTAGRG